MQLFSLKCRVARPWRYRFESIFRQTSKLRAQAQACHCCHIHCLLFSITKRRSSSPSIASFFRNFHCLLSLFYSNATMDEDEGQLSTTFPQPPPFYKHFTSQNLQLLKEFQESTNSKTREGNPSEALGPTFPRLLNLPPELRYLIPPEPPADGKYRSFGLPQNVCLSIG